MMRRSRKWPLFFFLASTIFAVGCSHHSAQSVSKGDPWPPQCMKWKRALAAPGVPTTIADVTSLLGAPPRKCGSVKPWPMLGIQVDREMHIVRVAAGSVADAAGMRPGERILRVNGKKAEKESVLLKIVQAHRSGDPSIAIETDKGSYSVVPRMVNQVEKCSWKVNCGTAGKGNYSFDVTCKFIDGSEAQCVSRCRD